MCVVLAGVSAGVIGLDEQGCINLPNRSASDLLATDLVTRIGEPIAAVVPEMASLVEAARQRPSWLAESQISLVRGAETRTLLVRVVAEFMATRLIGFVVTFDDVTELLSAQRKAAWADVARRIAHEIKNPLTPIQLSAERLKRKYLKEIASDPETFVTCTDTIVRQVGDIGRMVDEFSAFARMPAPVMAKENLVELCLQAIFLQQSANPAITYSTDLPPDGLELSCDAQRDRAGADQSAQECRRGGRRAHRRDGQCRAARPGPSGPARKRRRRRSQHRGQWPRLTRPGAGAADGTLCDHARARHRPGARDRQEHRRGSRRAAATGRSSGRRGDRAGDIPAHARGRRGRSGGAERRVGAGAWQLKSSSSTTKPTFAC
jgi:hypothetical protein